MNNKDNNYWNNTDKTILVEILHNSIVHTKIQIPPGYPINVTEMGLSQINVPSIELIKEKLRGHDYCFDIYKLLDELESLRRKSTKTSKKKTKTTKRGLNE